MTSSPQTNSGPPLFWTLGTPGNDRRWRSEGMTRLQVGTKNEAVHGASLSTRKLSLVPTLLSSFFLHELPANLRPFRETRS